MYIQEIISDFQEFGHEWTEKTVQGEQIIWFVWDFQNFKTKGLTFCEVPQS